MEIQQIIVFATVVLCAVLAGCRILHYFKRIEKNGNPCEGCGGECALKSLRTSKRHGCKKNAGN